MLAQEDGWVAAWTSVDGTQQNMLCPTMAAAKGVAAAMSTWVTRLHREPEVLQRNASLPPTTWLERHPDELPWELARTRFNEAAEAIMRQHAALDRGDTVNADEAQILVQQEIDRAVNCMTAALR